MIEKCRIGNNSYLYVFFKNNSNKFGIPLLSLSDKEVDDLEIIFPMIYMLIMSLENMNSARKEYDKVVKFLKKRGHI